MQHSRQCIVKTIKDSDRDIPSLVHTDRSNVYLGIKQEHEKGVPKRGTLSISKAKKVLKFSPKFDLETGIQDYFNYYKFR